MGQLIERQIKTLFGGVSRQPPAVRRDNQVEAADNALLSVVTGGFEKRPGSQHLSDITSSLTAGVTYAVHAINRDPTEQFFVLLGNGEVHVFDAITGAARTVTVADSDHYFVIEGDGSAIATILASEEVQWDSSETQFSWTYTSDNSSIVVVVEGSATGAFSGEEATLDTFTGTSDSGNTTITSNNHRFIRVRVTTAGSGGDTFTLRAAFKDTSYLLGADPEEFAFVTVADFTFIANRTLLTRVAEAGTGTITSTVQTFADLPAASGSGNIHRVRGDDVDNFESFYVRDNGSGDWVETVDPTAHNNFDKSLMPYRLTRNADATFTFGPADYAARQSGDELVNPNPSFIGKAITDVFFHRARLGVLADENVYYSRSGEPLDMWAEKAVTVLDTDPIDRAASTTQVTLLKWATPFRKLLFVTSDNAQFEVGADGAFAPDTATLDLATSYEASPNAKPITMGDVLYFASTNPRGSVVFEYFFDEANLSNTAADITKHTVDYIPQEILQFAADPTSGTLFVLSSGEQNALFVYRTFWDGDQKVQSSWSRWTFGTTEADAVVNGVAVLSGFVVIVVTRPDGTMIEQIAIETEAPDTAIGFIPLIDQRTIVTASFDATSGYSTWALPYEHEDDGLVVLGGNFSGDSPGRQLLVTYPTKTTLTLATVTAGQTVIINGVTFTAHASTTTPVNREFSISGNDEADAEELLTLINDASFGVTGITATRSGAVLTLRESGAPTGSVAVTVSGTAVTGNTVTVADVDDEMTFLGDFSSAEAYCGRPYEMDVELSQIYLRDEGGAAQINGRLQLKDLTLDYTDTGYFKVEVTPEKRSTQTYEFTGRTIGGTNPIGAAAIDENGTFKVPVLAGSHQVQINIKNDTPFPSVINSLSWRGLYNEITAQE